MLGVYVCLCVLVPAAALPGENVDPGSNVSGARLVAGALELERSRHLEGHWYQPTARIVELMESGEAAFALLSVFLVCLCVLRGLGTASTLVASFWGSFQTAR